MSTVLIVDDDLDTVQMLRVALEDEGMTVLGLTRPDQVQDVVSSHRPDVCLIDLMLTKECGIEVAQALRDAGTTAPLIAMSGSTFLADIARECSLFVDVFEKPFDLEVLLIALTEAMEPESAEALFV